MRSTDWMYKKTTKRVTDFSVIEIQSLVLSNQLINSKMRTTFNLAFFCRPSKSDKKGFAPIELSINICGNRTLVALPMKENPTTFAKLTKTKKTNYLQDYLNQQRQTITQIVTTLTSHGKPVTPESIKEYIRTGGIQVYQLSDLIRDYMKTIEDKNVDYDAYKRFSVVYDDVMSVVGDKQLTSVSYDDMLKVNGYLYSHYAKATASGKFNKVRRMFTYAVNMGHISNNPTYGIPAPKGKAKIEFLTDEEVRMIESKNIVNERLEKVRKCFLLQCYTGLAYIDLCSFDKDKVKKIGNTFIYTNYRCKTDIVFNAVIMPKGVEILESINWDIKSIIMSNQKLNNYLKELGAICGISQSLHSHLARKTYATMLLNSGVDLQTVKRCVGHESNSAITTKIYAFLQEQTVVSNVEKALKIG